MAIIKEECKNCKCVFYAYACKKQRFCSHNCYWQNLIGKKHSEEHNNKISISSKGKPRHKNSGRKKGTPHTKFNETQINKKQILNQLGV